MAFKPFANGRPPKNPNVPKGLKAELARELNTTPSYVGSIFSRRRRPGVDMAIRLQRALADRGYELTLDDLLKGSVSHPLFG